MNRNGFEKQVQMDFPPMYGTSRHRNEVDANDDSGNVELVEDGGELKIHLGASGADEYTLTTQADGQYRAGTYAEAAFGVRIPTGLTGQQEVRVGLDAPFSGLGWGFDAKSLFTFWTREGSITRYRPEDILADPDWTVGPGVNVDPAAGNIYKCLARMYGYGPLLWALEQKYQGLNGAPNVPVDKRIYEGKVNVQDFNKPLRVVVKNGGTASALDVFIGGRQYSIWGKSGKFEFRETTDIIRNFSTAGTGTWEPLIAIRKKPSFPPGTSRRNSVRVGARQLSVSPDGPIEMRYTQEADVQNPDSDWLSQGSMRDDSETAVETIIDSGGENGNEYQDPADTSDIQVDSDRGGQFGHLFASGQNNKTQPAEKRMEVPLGTQTNGVLWVYSNQSVTLDATLGYEQQL